MTVKLHVDPVTFDRMQRASAEADGDPSVAAALVTGIDVLKLKDAVRTGTLEVIVDRQSMSGDHEGKAELR